MSDLEDAERFGQLIALVEQQAMMLYALHEYLRRQPFYDEAQFAALHAEFRADLGGAVQRHSKSPEDAALALLRAFQGPRH